MVRPFVLRQIGERKLPYLFFNFSGCLVSIFYVLNEIQSLPTLLQHLILKERNLIRISELLKRVEVWARDLDVAAELARRGNRAANKITFSVGRRIDISE